MKKRTLFLVYAVTVLLMAAIQKVSTQITQSLKENFRNDFLIGAALNPDQIEKIETVTYNLIRRQFNAATPENIMKAEIIHPGWDNYNFALNFY